jgi:hypothetical protein
MPEKFYYPILRKLKIDSWNKLYAIYWSIASIIFLLFYMSGILVEIGRLVLYIVIAVFYGAFMHVGKPPKNIAYLLFWAFIGILFWFVYTSNFLD